MHLFSTWKLIFIFFVSHPALLHSAAAAAAMVRPDTGLTEPCDLPEDGGGCSGVVTRTTMTADESDTTALHDACKRNDVATAVELLHAGVRTDEQDAHGNTPLHYAVQNKCTPLIAELLITSSDAVGDKIRRNKAGQAPYHMLFEKPLTPLTYDDTEPTLLMTMALLIAANPDEANRLYLIAKNEIYATAPVIAPRSAYGIMPDPLHARALEGRIDVVRKLLRSGMFSADTRDVRGYTVLMALANYPRFDIVHGDIVQLLIDEALPTQIRADCSSHTIQMELNHIFAQELLAALNDEGLTALHLAARINNAPCVAALLSAGANPLSSSELLDMTPFGTTIRYGAFDTFTVFLNYFRENGIVYDRPALNGSFPSDELFFEPTERVFKDVRNDLLTLEYYLGKKAVLR